MEYYKSIGYITLIKSEVGFRHIAGFPPTFFLCRYLRHIKALSFTFTLANDFQFRNELLDFFLGRLWQLDPPFALSFPIFTNLGLHLLIKTPFLHGQTASKVLPLSLCGASKPCYLFHSFHPFLNSWSFVHYLRIETVGFNGRAEYYTFHNRMVDELQNLLGFLDCNR